MKIVYCDDDRMSGRVFEKFSDKYSSTHGGTLSLDIFESSEKFIEDVIGYHIIYDIYFLDILMPGYNGIELAKLIREYDKDGIIIFITGSTDYFREAYALEAIQYIEKPMAYGDVERCYDRALKILSKHKKTISVRLPKGLKTVNTDDIVYVESFLHVLNFHLSDNTDFETANSSITLSKLLSMLPYPNFYAVSRSCIVNLDYAEHIQGEELIMRKKRNSKAVIRIPVKQLGKLKEKYKEYSKSK